MDQPRTSTIDPTLDAQRTDQLRTFLTVEAAADAASAPARAGRTGRRRLVGGIAAAVVLGAGLFAVTSIAGGPSSGPASVQTANAVAIEQAEPGWTTIRIADIDADPDAVVAELRAAGIAAERQPLGITRDAEGRVTLGSFEEQPAGRDITMVGLGDAGDAGDQGLAGLSLSSPGTSGSHPVPEGASSEEIEAGFAAYLDGLGAKMGTDGSISVRNDADLTVLVLTED